VESLQFRPGIHLIKGDNGSGKTTFFKCMAGISPCEGDISIGDLSLYKAPTGYRYQVNFAEAEPLYPAFLTARDLMQFVGHTKKASEEQMRSLTATLGIDTFYEKSCGTYSSGMLKKLSLALAFLGTPRMIILDEPLITLDEGTRTALFTLINQNKEVIFLLSSHQAIESHELAINQTFTIRNKTLVLG
jgi:ABC-2 type transport system ATP-binding protein